MTKRGFKKVPAMVLACGLVLALVPTACTTDGNADGFLLELRGRAVEIIPLQDIMVFSSATYDLMGLDSVRHIVQSTIGVNGSIVDGELEFISHGIPTGTDHLFSIGDWFEMMGKNVSNISDEDTTIIHLGLRTELPEDIQNGTLIHARIVMDYFTDSTYRMAVPIFVDRPVSFAVFEDRAFELKKGWNVMIFEYNLNDAGEIVEASVYTVDPDDPFLGSFQFVVWWMN